MAVLGFGKKDESPRTYERTVAFGANSRRVNEGQGEVARQEAETTNKDLGEKHPFDPRITEALVKNYGLCGGIVDKYVNYIWGQGFYVECKEPDGEKALKIINKFNKDVGMTIKGRAWIKEALVKPGGYFEIERGPSKTDPTKKVITGLKLLDGKYMRIKRDKFGKIEGYTQFIGGVKGISASNKPIPFKAEDIVALHYNVVGDMAYGLGIVWPNVLTLEDMLSLEKSMHKLIKRKANSPMHIKIGSIAPDGRPIMPTPEAIETVRSAVETMTDDTEWVTGPDWNIATVEFGKLGEKFEAPLKHDIFRLVVGFQMPETIMGGGNIAEGLADNNSDDWERTITTKQEQAEYVLETLYRQVLLENGLDLSVEVIWGQPTNKEKTERIAQIVSMMGVVQPVFKIELEKQLAILMGVDPEMLEDADAVAQREIDKEDAMKQPNVPGDKNKKSSAPPSNITLTPVYIPEGAAESIVRDVERMMLTPGRGSFTTTTIESFDPMSESITVKEWLGFDYSEYTKFVIDATKTDAFTLLKADSAAEQLAGYLDDAQVEELRFVMQDAFENGHSMKRIADQVKERVKPGDLYEEISATERGKLLVAQAFRVYSIARSETTRLANLGSQDFYKASDVTEIRWVASIGKRTCPQCAALNGQVFEVNTKQLPPLHTMCRCSILPVINK